MEVLPFLKCATFTNKIGYYYRVRCDSLTTGIDQSRLDSMYPAFEKLYVKFSSATYMPYRDIFETQTFVRIILGGVMRVSFQNPQSSRDNIKYAISYMDRVMPTWRKNKYLCLGKHRSKSKKHLAVKLSAVLIRNNLYGLLLFGYKFILTISGKDIRL